MTYFTGINGKLNYYDGSTNYSAIGYVEEFESQARGRRIVSEGVGTRWRYTGRLVDAVPTFMFRMALADVNFLINYAMVDKQANMSKFDLRYFDGQEYGQLNDALVDSVDLDIAHGRPIVGTFNGIAMNLSGAASAYSFASDVAYPPMSFKDVSTLTVNGGNYKPDFRTISLNVRNNVAPDITGNVLGPGDILEGKADYRGRIEVAKDSNALFGNVLNGSALAVVIALADHQASPVTKTLTFNNCDLVTTMVRAPMDLIVARMEFESNQLVIT